MKSSEEFLDKGIKGKWQVPSQSSDETHTVRFYEDGSWACSCPALKECKHIKKIKLKLSEGRGRIVFDGYNPWLKPLRTDKSVRVTIDTSKDQYDRIKDILKLPEGIYKITIEPK